MMKIILIYRKIDIFLAIISLGAIFIALYLMSAILYEVVVYWAFWSKYY